MHEPFGQMLKDWRGRRRMSQLALGLAADVSARHIAFLETGRSQPSRAMVIRLSEVLDVPRSARNPLLNAAGFSPTYRARDLSDGEMAPVRAAMRWMLERHQPYPAFAIDRHWRIVDLNVSAQALLGPAGVDVGQSLLDAIAEPGPLRRAIDNWPEVARYMLARLRTESAHLGGDPVLDQGAARLAREVGEAPIDAPVRLPPLVATRYRMGDHVLALISTIAQFGSAEDIALADLRIELMFPADEASRLVLEALAGSAEP